MSISNFKYGVIGGFDNVNGIPPLSYRRSTISIFSLENDITYIGDAAFSLCKSLKQIVIPSSVDYIGVAAFCCSGLESIMFLGIPSVIERSAFVDCNNLCKVFVPSGYKHCFYELFKDNILEDYDCENVKYDSIVQPQPGRISIETDLFGNATEHIIQQPNLFPSALSLESKCELTYNCQRFAWSKGDTLKLQDLFVDLRLQHKLVNVLFRRKAVFIVIKRKIIDQLQCIGPNAYCIPFDGTLFKSKYTDKYGTTIKRIIFFVCDDGINATFYDECRLSSVSKDLLVVTSVL